MKKSSPEIIMSSRYEKLYNFLMFVKSAKLKLRGKSLVPYTVLLFTILFSFLFCVGVRTFYKIRMRKIKS